MFGKVNVKGGLTGGCAHCVITTTFARCGVVTARQGFAGAANAPLTGFHSNERSPWSGGGSSSVPVVGMSLGSMIGI